MAREARKSSVFAWRSPSARTRRQRFFSRYFFFFLTKKPLPHARKWPSKVSAKAWWMSLPVGVGFHLAARLFLWQRPFYSNMVASFFYYYIFFQIKSVRLFRDFRLEVSSVEKLKVSTEACDEHCLFFCFFLSVLRIPRSGYPRSRRPILAHPGREQSHLKKKTFFENVN